MKNVIYYENKREYLEPCVLRINKPLPSLAWAKRIRILFNPA